MSHATPWMRPRARIRLAAVCFAITALAGCVGESSRLPTELSAGEVSLSRAGKASICHRADEGVYQLLTVSANAIEAHQAHGDVAPGAPIPGGSAILDAECTPQPGVSFDGVYRNSWTSGDFLHTDVATVTGLSVTGSHTFTNGSVSGGWDWTGTITPSPTDPTQGTITGEGTRWDSCCGTMTFTLDSGAISVNADGTAQLFYEATHPEWGKFGSAAYRSVP